MNILELREVSYIYRTQYQRVEALKGISHSFETGKLHAIMGRSGSGKTTLLSLMPGLDLPTAGQMLFEGTPTAEMNLERYRREKAAALIERMDLPASVLNRFPTMLSGGAQPRAAIARALGMRTRLLLADEPTGNLDMANGEIFWPFWKGWLIKRAAAWWWPPMILPLAAAALVLTLFVSLGWPY